MRRLMFACMISGTIGAVAAVGAVKSGVSALMWDSQGMSRSRTPAVRTAAQFPQVPAAVPGRGVMAPYSNVMVDGSIGIAAQAPAAWETLLPPVGQFTPDELVNIAVYEKANKSVVNIRTKSIQEGAFFFMNIISEGEGSGSVIDRQGHILTNYHVVEGARAISVTLYDGMAYEAQLMERIQPAMWPYSGLTPRRKSSSPSHSAIRRN
jgi:S1-C subfamily serine protease